MIKKLFILLIGFQFIISSGFAAPLIVDEFAEQTLDPTPVEKYDKSKSIIEDDIAKNFILTTTNKVIPLRVQESTIVDEIAMNIDKKKIKPIKVKTKYNYTIAPIAIQLKVTKDLTTKNDGIKEGDLITFKTIKTTKLGKLLLPKDTEVIGRVETISPNDLLGTPADLVLDNFVVKNDEKINLYGRVKKRGADRSWWLYPVYQAGNIAFWAAGYPFILVRGGHAKLSTKEVYTVYYEIQ